jgi:putative hydrolase of the HAD superfamily
VSKPHPAIFQAALAKANVAAHEAVHVGDDYRGDVVGAQNAKMHALFLARKEPAVAPGDCPVITTLREVLPYLRSHQHLAFPPAPGPVPSGEPRGIK